ncbi:MAG: DUF4388 domain-containing protein [Deltaproteobacteria bacterium]|nr:DUF4388 domain-containing protein [Deltaproteobacteria bacterium]
MAQIGSERLLDAEQRAWLGLEEDESARVLTRSGRSIVLERWCGDATALPWDRDLVLMADVRAFPMADILHLIHGSAKSGFLFFENGAHEKAVYLHRGEVVFASSNQKVDRLGECLLRSAAITLEQHREAQRAFTPQHQYGKLLVERGVLTPREVWNGVKGQVEEIVRSLFSYGAGTAMLWEGEVRPDNVVRLSLPTRRLIAEGLRRRDELLKLLAWLENPRVRLEFVAEKGDDLAGTERALCDAFANHSGFVAACRDVGMDPLSGARTVHHLRLIGAVRVGETEATHETRDTRLSDRESVRECVEAHLKVLAELAAPIVAVEGAEGIRLRLERVVEEGAERFPELLAGLDVGPGGVLDPEPVIERALGFPGDREREVCLAFGELISYLEFELANHPRIDDPEVFLEAVRELRERL